MSLTAPKWPAQQEMQLEAKLREAKQQHPLMDVKETAAYTGLAVSTLNKLRISGLGPVYIRLLRRCLYSKEDVDSWIVKHRRKSTSDKEAA